MSVTGSQKCAIFLCKFSNTLNDPAKDPSFFWDLFVGRGNQGLNDYYTDISLDNINLDGSQVFGWRNLPVSNTDYQAANPDRYSKIHGVLPYFPEVDVSKYNIIVSVFNGDVGDNATSGGILVNYTDLNETFLAHEMGHNLGLNHSYDTSGRQLISWSGPGEYYDMYDIMSALNVYTSYHPLFESTGPRLCALYSDQLGWIPESKIFRFTANMGSSPVTIDLKSMSHSEQPGYMMVYLNDNFTIEYRTREGWDASIPDQTILINQINDGLAYLEMSDPKIFNHAWLPGQTWTNANFYMQINGGLAYRVTVESYMPEIFTARITISAIYYASKIPRLVGQLVGGVASDGGGGVLVNGRFHPVPPRGPESEILQDIADLLDAESQGGNANVQEKINSLKNIGETVQGMLGELNQ